MNAVLYYNLTVCFQVSMTTFEVLQLMFNSCRDLSKPRELAPEDGQIVTPGVRDRASVEDARDFYGASDTDSEWQCAPAVSTRPAAPAVTLASLGGAPRASHEQQRDQHRSMPCSACDGQQGELCWLETSVRVQRTRFCEVTNH